jgi:hypothetical protein
VRVAAGICCKDEFARGSGEDRSSGYCGCSEEERGMVVVDGRYYVVSMTLSQLAFAFTTKREGRV